jgi:glycine/D-amino acid oxidase-like deaminating enzyme
LAPLRVLEQTAALRPVADDDLPIVGAVDGWENAWLALAGGRKGMLFAAGMAEAVAQLVTTGSTELSIGACSAGRWARHAVGGAAL